MKNIEEYVFIKIIVNDKHQEVSLKVSNFIDGKERITEEQQQIPMKDFHVQEIINMYLTANPSIAEYFMGADLGYAVDFAEFWVKAVIGERNRHVVRVQMLGVEYPFMRKAFNMMDDIFDRGRNTMRSGVDIGGAGTAFFQELIDASPDKHYRERCIPIQFGGKGDLLGPDGEPILDKDTEKPIRRRIKTLATGMLVKRIQGLLNEYPCDPEIIRDFTGHTSIPRGDGDVVYSKANDHTVDADRAATYAYYRPSEEEMSLDDIATSGQKLSTVSTLSGDKGGGVFLT